MARPQQFSSRHQQDNCMSAEQDHPIALLPCQAQPNTPLPSLDNQSIAEDIDTKQKADVSDAEEVHIFSILARGDDHRGSVVIPDQHRFESEDHYDPQQITLPQANGDSPSADLESLPGKITASFDGKEDSLSARKRSNVFATSLAPLTKTALHQIDTARSDKSSEYSSSGIMASYTTSSQSTKDTEGNITPYHPNYKNFLNERDIWDAKENQLPENMTELLAVMEARRESPGPSATMHKEYVRNMQNSSNEAVATFLQYSYFVKAAWIEDGCKKLPRLAPPKPDMAYGWEASATNSVFAMQKLTQNVLKPKKFDHGSSEGRAKSDSTQSKSEKPTYEVRSWAAPNDLPAFTWPVFTIEGKGDAGKLKIAHLQNMNNGSVMVNSILGLKRRVGSEGDFYDRAMVLTLDATPESLQLHCHWVSRIADGRIKFFMGELADWRPRNKKADQFLDAYRSIINAVEYIRKLALEELQRDCQALVDRQGVIQVPELLTPTGQSVLTAEPDKSSQESEHAELLDKRACV